MDAKRFDEDIRKTFEQFGETGVNVQLLSAKDSHVSQPPYDWVQVMMKVIPVVPDPEPWAETWRYGGVLQHDKIPLPIGMRPIDINRMISAIDAAKKLPPGFNLQGASCDLYWALHPDVKEPYYHFTSGDLTILIGAYSGDVMEPQF
ncbi:hypothetical protein DSLASN_12900 [Desulfoluna limicola]|uniref:Uncharacterized protein n=1 Tax=Desulfoluna limicola TaxID=2810562 RepID=A0ABM7PER2_9BACT|nr:hypothetical protein [Desulfoluna limicola]BCS95658.1 hypothetical protein DSLASN_12900 [Desulfoluna limicola]